jgi:acetyltransferase
LISSFVDRASQHAFGFNKILSVGNKSDVDESEMVEYLTKDKKTEVIALYLEGIAQPQRFIRAVQATQKPVVVLKSGRSKRAAEAIASHTGSIVGQSQQISTVLAEAGAIEAKGFDELFDIIHLLSRHRSVSRYHTAVITNAGGVGVLSVDAAEDFRVQLSKLQEHTETQLTKDMPPAAAVENPIDVLGDAVWERYRLAMETVLAEKHVGSLLVMLTPQLMTPVEEIARGIIQMQEASPHKPIIPVFIGGTVIEKARELFIQAQLPWFESPEQAMRALALLYRYSKATPNQKLWEAPATYVKKKTIQEIQEAIQKNQASTGLDFATLALIAKEFDLPLPKFAYINKETDLAPALKKIGTPCVMKIVAGDLLHRSDVGGVKVGLMNLKEAREFWQPRKEFQMIVQEQAKKGIEVFVGIKRDPELGLFLVLGWGGIYAEIIDDFAMATIPATKPMILKTLKRTKLYRVLTGARGTHYDVQFVVDTVFQLSLFAQSFPQVAEIDVNPIVVYEKGGSMVDFKVVISSKEVSAR